MYSISVIIPSYKPGNYIYSCLDSLINQTLELSSFEVIVVLNGPKDPYWSILSSYIQQYNNIKLLYEQTAGVSNARNVGLAATQGEYITFVDDDDVLSPAYLKSLLKSASRETISISNVYSFINSVDERRNNFFICNQLKKVNKKGQKFGKNDLFRYRSFFTIPWGKLIHRDIIGSHQFDSRFTNGEDALFMTSITDNLSQFTFVLDDAIYFVRERVGSASRKKIPKSKLFFDSFLLIKEYLMIYLKHPCKYNFPLFISRIPGVLKNAYILSKNR